MKSYYRNILFASAVLLAAAACTKTVPEGPQVTDMQINISASEGLTKSGLNNGTFNPTGTKSLLDADAFAADGNRIQIYDYVNGSSSAYIDDQIGPDVSGSPLAEATAGVWPFVNGPHQWTPGTHKFFGWLAKDLSSGTVLTPESLISGGFSYAAQKLNIPSITMGPTTPQFDFMYSDIFTTEPINAPVQLEFKHLFSAVSFGIVNDASSSVTVTSFSVKLYNTKSANIDYSDTGIPEYTKTASSPGTYRSASSLGTLSGMSNGISAQWVNAFNTSATAKEYVLMWPHTAEELADCEINIVYNLNNQRYTQSLSFPAIALSAGERYHFDIFIADKAPIRINYLVVDWAEIKNEYTFE